MQVSRLFVVRKSSSLKLQFLTEFCYSRKKYFVITYVHTQEPSANVSFNLLKLKKKKRRKEIDFWPTFRVKCRMDASVRINHRDISIRLTSRDRHATEPVPFYASLAPFDRVSKRGWRVRGWSVNILEQADWTLLLRLLNLAWLVMNGFGKACR